MNLGDWVFARMESERNAIESAAWAAMSDPQHRGVAVIGPPEIVALDDPFPETIVRLDENVPSMNVYRFPGQRAYDAWVERGCPTEIEETP